MGKKIKGSLSLQLLCGVLASLTAAAAAFALILALCNFLLDKTVYGQTFARRRADGQFEDLQDYVDREEISSTQIQRLGQWFGRGKRVYLTVFDQGDAVYTSPMPKGIRFVFDPDNLSSDDAYTLRFSDGRRLQAYLLYYAGDVYYILVRAAAAPKAGLHQEAESGAGYTVRWRAGIPGDGTGRG